MNVGPGFGDWLQTTRTLHQMTLRQLADQAHVPHGTIISCTTRRYTKPRPVVLRGLSAAFEVPILVPVIVGGQFKTMPRVLQSDRNTLAGAYIRIVRESHRISLSDAATRWSERWPATPISGSEWSALERDGMVPRPWTVIGRRFLAQLPETWLWGVLDAVCPDHEVSTDLIILAHICGRLSHKVCAAFHAARDYDQVLDLMPTANPKDAQSTLSHIHHAVSRMTWSIADATEEPVPPGHALKPGSEAGHAITPEEYALIQRFRQLSHAHQQAVAAVIDVLIP